MNEKSVAPENIEAEKKKLEAEANAKNAEAEKLRKETEIAAYEAEMCKMDLNKKKEDEEKRKAKDEFHYVYRLSGETINGTSVRSCIDQLSTWHRLDPNCEIVLVLHSPGGSVIDGMALFDYIQELKEEGHVVITKAQGMTASMAGILLQAGTKRIITKECWLLIHESQFGASGSYGEVTDTVKWVSKIQDRILSIFAARSKMTKANIKRRWKRKNWWLDSDEALKYGFVDEIVSSLEIKK